MSLASKTINGLKWSYLFTVINVISQLALTAILARLLSPKDYGLVAMGNVVLRFGSYLAQMGIGQSLIQRNEIDKKNVFTAYVLTLVLSLSFYVILFLLAPLSKYVFSSAGITDIIRILAINIVFNSIATVPVSLLRVNYKYRLLGTIDFIAFIAGNGIIGIWMAAHGFGVWSLVTAVLVQGTIQLLLAFYFTREYFSFTRIHLDSGKKFLNYGSRYTIGTFLEIIMYNTDYIIIGHYFKESVLGIYNRAALLVQLPSQYISANLIKVLFPTLNEVKSDKGRFVKYYLSVNYLLGFVLFGVCVFISVYAADIVHALLGSKWNEAAPILRIIALAVPFNLLINYNGLVYDVYAHLNQKILIKIFHMAVMVSLFFLFKPNGLKGIASAYLITEASFYFLYSAVSYRMLKINIASSLKTNAPFLYVIVVVGSISLLVQYGSHYITFSDTIRFIVEMTCAPLLILLAFFVYAPKLVKATVIEVLPFSILNQNRYFNYLLGIKVFRKYWDENWNLSSTV
ncbi:MAG TPA: lipopolysaccharide biosynthesis protein [Flavisolibacter sp.]|jgi:O-antigen/teichoic acid export membrane protein|nr:lipopolysaccharide biosynthesis protein [Flavisolibacter sp.]